MWDVLSWLAAGMTEQQILDDYPELEPDDFRAVYEFASKMGRRVACQAPIRRESLAKASRCIRVT